MESFLFLCPPELQVHGDHLQCWACPPGPQVGHTNPFLDLQQSSPGLGPGVGGQ